MFIVCYSYCSWHFSVPFRCRQYADSILRRLYERRIAANMLFLAEHASLEGAISEFGRCGSHYVIIIMPKHEETRAITINIYETLTEKPRGMMLPSGTRNCDGNGHQYSVVSGVFANWFVHSVLILTKGTHTKYEKYFCTLVGQVFGRCGCWDFWEDFERNRFGRESAVRDLE